MRAAIGSNLSYGETARWHHRAGHAARSSATLLLGIVALVALAVLLFVTRWENGRLQRVPGASGAPATALPRRRVKHER